MAKQRTQDSFYKRAKKEGYLARSVFKLEEILDKNPEILKLNLFLDLGSSPGSWVQYLIQKKKKVVGIDLASCTFSHPDFTFFQEDITTFDYSKLPFQPEVVLSDLAPKTTGIKLKDQFQSFELTSIAFDVASKLKPKFFVAKIFESEFAKKFIQNLPKGTKVIRPKASMIRGSKEIYIISKL